MDYVAMLLLILVMGAGLMRGLRYSAEGNSGFFDRDNTRSMRALWCIIIILVHIPDGYGNPIQQALGSFAYIGVTFFFMTSAYGLCGRMDKNQGIDRYFWRRRLPRLLVPQLIINALMTPLLIAWVDDKPSMSAFFMVDAWVIWLLVCYAIYWAACRISHRRAVRYALISGGVALLSFGQYLASNTYELGFAMWPSEICGFIWGALLAAFIGNAKKLSGKGWLAGCIIACAAAGVIGMAYLKYKWVPFFGEYLLKVVLGAAITVFVLMLNLRFSIGNRVLAYVGEISYEVYLVHASVIKLMQSIFGSMNSGAFILIAIVITLIISVAVHGASQVILEKIYHNKWFAKK